MRLEIKRLAPEDRGRLVTAFLESFFERYVAYGFTAEMEERLDDVSGGRIDWKTVLHDFWRDFSAAVDGTKGLRIKEVLEALDRLLAPHFFRNGAEGGDPRLCPACNTGRLGLKLGRFGAFIGCSNYPECRYTRRLVLATGDDPQPAAAGASDSRVLGEDPATGLPVSLRKGPYGPYVQLGESATNGATASEDASEPQSKSKGKSKAKGKRKARPEAEPAGKPKRISLPRGVDAATLDLQKALALLSLPRTLGTHPETGEAISAGLGRFGPYLRASDIYVSLKGDDDVLSIGLNRAIDLLANARPDKTKGKSLGEHPAARKPVLLKVGRYGV